MPPSLLLPLSAAAAERRMDSTLYIYMHGSSASWADLISHDLSACLRDRVIPYRASIHAWMDAWIWQRAAQLDCGGTPAVARALHAARVRGGSGGVHTASSRAHRPPYDIGRAGQRSRDCPLVCKGRCTPGECQCECQCQCVCGGAEGRICHIYLAARYIR